MTHALLFFALAAAPAPTDAELTAFGKAIAADFSAGRDGFTPRFDLESFLERAVPARVVTAEQRAAFGRGVVKGLGNSWAAIAAQCAAGKARMSQRRNVTLDGLPGMQLRLLYEDGTFNFFEFGVLKNARGELRIVDFVDAFDGAVRSADARVNLAMLVKRDQGPVLERLLGKDVLSSAELAALKTMRDALTAGRLEEVVKGWQALSERARKHRTAMTTYLGALSQLPDRAAYEQANERFLELFPDDPSAEMRALELALGRGNAQRALSSVATLEQRFGSDPVFEILRADVRASSGKFDDAFKHLERATTLEPGLDQAWGRLIDFGLQQRRWTDVAKWMTAAETQAGLKFDLESEGFAAFLKSNEGRAWAKARTP